MGVADKGTAQSNKISHVLEICFARKDRPLKKCGNREFPGGTVAKIQCSPSRGPGFDPWSGNQILVRELERVAMKTCHSLKNVVHLLSHCLTLCSPMDYI